MDTSESMQQALPKGKSVAERYAERFFRQKSDQAFIMDFGYSSESSRNRLRMTCRRFRKAISTSNRER